MATTPPDFSLRGSLRVEISQSWTCEIRSRGRSWLKRRETPCCSPLSKSSTNRRVGAFVVVFRSRNYTYIRTVLVRFDPKQIDGFFFLARLFQPFAFAKISKKRERGNGTGGDEGWFE